MTAPRRAHRYPELTTAQAALVARVKPTTVRLWVLRGHVQRTRPGFVDAATLLDYLDSRGDRGQRKGSA